MTALMRVIIIAYVQGTMEAEGVSTVSDACPPPPPPPPPTKLLS